eukprot:TRINITY_DN4516_c2_g1_i1.p1 TRINITY_DN4516_c2_g1~~TRINITY_DN4516_c2_g1_i1.p1  ORF type:complete len:411 (+),score=204.62 TRINITY_DN4516_c2_g1_i1:77-1309(+)
MATNEILSPRFSNQEALRALKRKEAARAAAETKKPKQTISRDKTGWLVKRIKRKITGTDWKRLYCEFIFNEKTLRCLRQQNDTKPKYIIDFNKVLCVRPITIEKKPLSPAFSIRTLDQVHFFIAEDNKERDRWLRRFVKLHLPLLEICSEIVEEQEAEETRKVGGAAFPGIALRVVDDSNERKPRSKSFFAKNAKQTNNTSNTSNTNSNSNNDRALNGNKNVSVPMNVTKPIPKLSLAAIPLSNSSSSVINGNSASSPHSPHSPHLNEASFATIAAAIAAATNTNNHTNTNTNSTTTKQSGLVPPSSIPPHVSGRTRSATCGDAPNFLTAPNINVESGISSSTSSIDVGLVSNKSEQNENDSHSRDDDFESEEYEYEYEEYEVDDAASIAPTGACIEYEEMEEGEEEEDE